MIGRGVRVGAVVVVALGLVAACGSSDRPADVSIDDVDPCDLISRADLAALQVAAKPQPIDVVPGVNEDGTSCGYTPRNGDGIYVGAVTNEGIDRWTGSSEEHATVDDMPRIRGYRTIKVGRTDFSSGPHDTCKLYVDVADDQSLKVEVGENSEKDPPTCDTAHRFAAAAMKTLTK